MVARHSFRIILISPLGSTNVTQLPSLATIRAALPAPRTILPPWPAVISTLCTSRLAGIAASGIALPTFGSHAAPLSITSPTFIPIGHRI